MADQYYSPQQEPGFDKRLIIVSLIAFAAVMILQSYLFKQKPQPNQPQKPAATAPAPGGNPPAPTEAQPAAAKPAAKETAAKGGSKAQPVVTKQASAESQTVIDTDLYHVVLSNHGGQATSWILKRYDDEKGHPLDLINQAAAAKFGFPLSLWTPDEALRNKLAAALYTVDVKDGQGGDGKAQRTVTYEYADQDVSVRKAFTFELGPWTLAKNGTAPGSAYVVKVEASVTQNGKPVAAYPAWPAGFGDQVNAIAYGSGAVDYQYGDKVERTAAKKVANASVIRGPFQWAGAMDQYFGAVFLPDDMANSAMVQLHNSLQMPQNPADPNSKQITVDIAGAAVGNVNGATIERMFAGPKNLSVLESVHTATVSGANNDLRQMVDFGFFSWMGRPLFLWLRWTHDHWSPNWGWAIVILTVIINAALLPLRLSSMKSALKMQKLQPQMNAVKDKYKAKMRNLKANDRAAKMEMTQQQNQEIAALFKREGANPVGGCLPLLIQMPFLIAFYTMLERAIELRHAHWLWITDLSAADPYKILPIAIIVTTVWMQKMTPQPTVDAAQQKMMMFMMPLMLGFMAWTVASGLAVYWVVGTIVSIVQQYAMNRTALGQEMRAMAMKRARKQAK
ncbi:MAG TPA: membrane protein insertase YidC [Terriglobales bacterium]|nr:membrane protein insertase YidC [Terriglobales bacterium]